MSEENKAMDWDSPVMDTNESAYRIPPEGDYRYRVLECKRATFQPKNAGGKIKTSCPKAELKLELRGRDGEVYEQKASVLLHESCMGILVSFLRSVGLRKHGDEASVPDWGKVPGAYGPCTVKHRAYKKNDGTDGTQADITWKDPGSTAFDKDIAAGSMADPFSAPF